MGWVFWLGWVQVLLCLLWVYWRLVWLLQPRVWWLGLRGFGLWLWLCFLGLVNVWFDAGLRCFVSDVFC